MTPWDLVWWSLAGTFAASLALGFLGVAVLAVGLGVSAVVDWVDARRASRAFAQKEQGK